MNRMLNAAMVIARRDYTATVMSKTFILFLVGPLVALDDHEVAALRTGLAAAGLI